MNPETRTETAAERPLADASHPLAEVVALARLALPLIIARAGHNLMGVVDTMVAGRLGPSAVGAVGLGFGAFFLVFIFPFGVVLGLDPLVSHAVGAKRRDRWEAGLVAARWIALAVSIPTMVAVLFLPDILQRLGQDPTVVEGLRSYMPFLAAAVAPMLLFHVYSTYLTAHGHTRQFVAIAVFVNVLNLVLNLWFVHGGLGLEPMGVAGIGAATLGCTLAEFVLLRAMFRPRGRFASIWVAWTRPRDTEARAIFRTGIPVGIQYGMEVAGFTVASVLLGLFGAVILAGHQIALSFAGLTFTAALGLGSAASVRVGQARGREDVPGMRRAGWTALGSGLGFALLIAVTMVFGRGAIASLYTSDPATLEAATGFLLIAAAFQLADQTQAIGFGVLRGLDDTRVPTLFNLVAYWLIGMPLGAWWAFGPNGDPRGVWWGLTVSLCIVAIALIVRFRVLTQRLSRR